MNPSGFIWGLPAVIPGWGDLQSQSKPASRGFLFLAFPYQNKF